jgi:hypothetical protein
LNAALLLPFSLQLCCRKLCTTDCHFLCTLGYRLHGEVDDANRTQMANTIAALATTPAQNYEGEPGYKNNPQVLLDGIKTVQLKTNVLTRVSLYSSGNIKITGKNSWAARARIVGSLNLAVYAPCSSGTGDNEHCKSNGTASWFAGALQGVNIHQAMKTSLSDFFTLNGYNDYNFTDVGGKETFVIRDTETFKG